MNSRSRTGFVLGVCVCIGLCWYGIYTARSGSPSGGTVRSPRLRASHSLCEHALCIQLKKLCNSRSPGSGLACVTHRVGFLITAVQPNRIACIYTKLLLSHCLVRSKLEALCHLANGHDCACLRVHIVYKVLTRTLAMVTASMFGSLHMSC